MSDDKTSSVAKQILELDSRHVFHPWVEQGAISPLLIVGGDGSYIYDAEGNKYLDFYSQYSNVNVGHQHPKVIDAMIGQIRMLSCLTANHANEPAARLGKRLAEISPGDLTKVVYTTSGSDANEGAIKIARDYTGKQKIITRWRSYHGNTYGAATLSGDPRRLSLEPGIPGVVHVLDNYCYRCPFSLEYPSCNIQCVEHIGQVIELEGRENIAAVLVEPVVGSNGCLVPPPEYWPRLREICNEANVLLIADEVVTGFGRTGEWFGCDHWNVVPDMLVLSKGLSSGYAPLGAVVIRQQIADFYNDKFFNIGMTHQSHPVSCAAAEAVIDVIEEEGLVNRAEKMGALLIDGLKGLEKKHISVGHVRGLGLYACLELVTDRNAKTPLVPWSTRIDNHSGMGTVMGRLRERHVLCSFRSNRIHIAPPLSIVESELQEGLDALDYALSASDDCYRA